MKRITIILSAIASLIFKGAEAQQIPLYTQYYFNQFIYNPAMAGTKEDTEGYMIFRKQWADIPGSPETRAIAVNGPSSDGKVGLGFYAFNDVTDISQRMAAYANYAYHINLGSESRLSFGLAGGVLDNRFDMNRIKVGSPNEPLLPLLAAQSRTTFDANFGMNVKIKNLQIGASAPQLLQTRVKYEIPNAKSVNYGLLRHYVMSAQYNIMFNNGEMSLTPMVLVRTAQNVPAQVDVNAIFDWKDKAWLGAGYRSNFGVTATAGVRLSNSMIIGYSYDFAAGNLSTYLGSSHEVTLGYKFGQTKRSKEDQALLEKVKNLDEKKFKDMERRSREREEELTKKIEELDEKVKSLESQRTTRDTVIIIQKSTTTGPAKQDLRGAKPTPTKGYYITAGVFGVERNAEKRAEELNKKGHNARVFKDPNNNMFYVYIDTVENYEEAKKAMKKYKAEIGDVWIKVIE